ncbi:hypothetical protein BWG23_01840 [Flavobacterium oreochromis]|nr:hypothetical protein BWG23_01840 [Flavobacterium oreochromis]
MICIMEGIIIIEKEVKLQKAFAYLTGFSLMIIVLSTFFMINKGIIVVIGIVISHLKFLKKIRAYVRSTHKDINN